MAGQLNLAQWQEQVESLFHVQLPSQMVALRLTAATDLGSSPGHERFELLFQGPLAPFLAQRTYPVAHEQLGQFDLFMVPIRKDQNGYAYQAVFSRLVSEA